MKITETKTRWFLRIPAPISVVMTAILIVMYFLLGFFPKTADLKQMYIVIIIIIIMNLIFSVIMTLNIFTLLHDKLKYSQTITKKENQQ